MNIEIKGKIYHSVRINLDGTTFNTPTKNNTKTLSVIEIDSELLQLQEKGIISIKILK